MTKRLITPPVGMAVSLYDARDAIRADDASLDASIVRWARGIAADAEHAVGRSFISQGWRLTLDAFPAEIELSRPPIIAVQSVKYRDFSGALQTLSPAAYVVDIASEPGRITLAVNYTWPETAAFPGAVIVDYTAGYGLTEADVPDAAKLYILTKLAEQIDPDTRLERNSVQSAFVNELLDGLRVYG